MQKAFLSPLMENEYSNKYLYYMIWKKCDTIFCHIAKWCVWVRLSVYMTNGILLTLFVGTGVIYFTLVAIFCRNRPFVDPVLCLTPLCHLCHAVCVVHGLCLSQFSCFFSLVNCQFRAVKLGERVSPQAMNPRID